MMRGEVLLLPPSAEKRKSSLCMSKTEEDLFNVRRDLNAYGLINNQVKRHSKNVQSEETMTIVLDPKSNTGALRIENPSTVFSSESKKHENFVGEEPGKDLITKEVSSSVGGTEGDSFQGVYLPQWGNIKRNRCNRGLILQPRSCSLVDESKSLQVQNIKDTSTIMNCGTVESKEDTKVKNVLPQKRENPCSPLANAVEHTKEHCRWEKRLRSSDSGELQRGISVQGGKRGPLPTSQTTFQQECLPHQSVSHNSVEKKSVSPDRHIIISHRIAASRKNYSLPKFSISLSRKEKEEDFLILKGSKLSKRPKRRPRAVERTLLAVPTKSAEKVLILGFSSTVPLAIFSWMYLLHDTM
ncbi:hypothetical protein KP509_22G058300 [Ceratopteris richardii]|uniref:Uncharacterized protein n=1 Tax=Ceratopteris richardii TaxID=49495 RepID=A0A8T2S6M8_CERRI|nr:hypothetical protein KP509_22G058300 [Ceratopteris richardii]